MRVLLTGASGNLGAYLIDALLFARHEVIACSGSQSGERSGVWFVPTDFTEPSKITRRLNEADPGVVLHAAAISSAEAVRQDYERAFIVNVGATISIGLWCHYKSRRLVFTSTDLVFDGSSAWNREDIEAKPVLKYGITKKEAEKALADGCPTAVIARLPLLFGPTRCNRPAFFDRSITALRDGKPQTFFEDEFRTPLDYGTAAQILVQLLQSDLAGILHVAGAERMSRFDLMTRAARAMGLNAKLVQANRRADVPSAETRPADVSLDTRKLLGLFPDLVRPTVEDLAPTWNEQ